MIVTFGGIKGGCGKTTLATHIAHYRATLGKKVLLVDTDDGQWTASEWVEHREAKGVSTPWTTIILSGLSVRTQIQKLKDLYDDIYIDTSPRDSQSFRAALTISDMLISPFHPKSYDIWTISKLKRVISEIWAVNPSLAVYAVISLGDVKGLDNDEARKILSESFPCLSTVICQRKSFSNASAQGLSVLELKVKDKKAIQEIKDLHSAIYALK